MQNELTAESGAAAKAEGFRISPRFLDQFERVAILALWSWVLWRVSYSPNPHAWLLIVSQTTILVFVLFRRPTTEISARPFDWLLAFVGTCTPGLVAVSVDPLAGAVSLAMFLVIFGDLFQIWAKLVLARSFGLAPANRGIKKSGPYRFVRHPMYLGYGLTELGLLLIFPSLFNVALFSFAWSIQVWRLMREEAFLSQSPEYQEVMKAVPWRLIPGIF